MRCSAPKMEGSIISSARHQERILVQVPYCRSLAQLTRNVVSYDANSSTPMCATDDDFLHVWRQAAY